MQENMVALENLAPSENSALSPPPTPHQLLKSSPQSHIFSAPLLPGGTVHVNPPKNHIIQGNPIMLKNFILNPHHIFLK